MHVSELGRKPRKVELVSTVDGGVYSFLDDGFGNLDDANAHRQCLRDNLQKRNPRNKAFPVYVLPVGPRPALLDGDLHGGIKGDPLQSARSASEPDVAEFIKQSVAVRNQRAEESTIAMSSEAAKVKRKAAKHDEAE